MVILDTNHSHATSTLVFLIRIGFGIVNWMTFFPGFRKHELQNQMRG